MDALRVVTLLLNTVWFGAAFVLFTLRSRAATNMLIARAQRDHHLVATVADSVTFLGAMNFALSLLSALLLVFSSLFAQRGQLAVLSLVFAVAHGGQFACNVPIALRFHAKREGGWPVLRGPMAFIFAVDLSLGLLNLLCCVLYARS